MLWSGSGLQCFFGYGSLDIFFVESTIKLDSPQCRLCQVWLILVTNYYKGWEGKGLHGKTKYEGEHGMAKFVSLDFNKVTTCWVGGGDACDWLDMIKSGVRILILLDYWVWPLKEIFFRWNWRLWLVSSTWGVFLVQISWMPNNCGRPTIPQSSQRRCPITALPTLPLCFAIAPAAGRWAGSSELEHCCFLFLFCGKFRALINLIFSYL